MIATITALLAALVVGVPSSTFVERWPYQHEEMQLHSWHEFWRMPRPRVIEPPPEHYRFGRGELIGRCVGISEIGVKCRWERARV